MPVLKKHVPSSSIIDLGEFVTATDLYLSGLWCFPINLANWVVKFSIVKPWTTGIEIDRGRSHGMSVT